MTGEYVTFSQFMHSVLVGVSGIKREMVRPAYQANPPKTPDFKTDWLAYNLTNFAVENGTAYQNGALLERYESFDCICYFYGLQALDYAAVVRDSFELSQNRRALRANDVGFKGASVIVHTPEIINNQYYERADLTLYFTRKVGRNYRILDFESAGGKILGNRAFTVLSRLFNVYRN